MKRILLKLFVFLILLFANINSIMACECIKPENPAKALENSKAVFSGKVTDIDRNYLPLYLGNKIEFQVYNSWKGVSDKSVTIYAEESSAACGYKFEENKEYLVYAYEDEGKLKTGLCTRTNLLENAQQDLKELGFGNVESEREYLYNPIEFLFKDNLIFYILFFIIIFGLLFYIKRIKK